MDWICDAILFDMDGTLVDSTALVVEMWGAWCRKRGVDLEVLLGYSHGRRTAETMRWAAPLLTEAEVEADAQAMLAQELVRTDGIRAVPGAAEAVSALGEERWAMVTAAPRALAEARLGAAGLPVPAVLIGAGEVTEGKPSPQGYLRAARELGFAPDRCVVVEDAPAGIEAGRRAGMRVLMLQTTYPDLSVDGIEAIPDLSYVQISRERSDIRLRLR